MKHRTLLLLTFLSVLLSGCSSDADSAAQNDQAGTAREASQAPAREETSDTDENTSSDQPEILHFVDVYQNPYQVEINPDIARHDYKPECFVHDGHYLSYTGDENYTYRLGVDVSEHQGYVDWAQLKENGFSFAFIRLGYRGYGQEGRICLDSEFHRNMRILFSGTWRATLFSSLLSMTRRAS